MISTIAGEVPMRLAIIGIVRFSCAFNRSNNFSSMIYKPMADAMRFILPANAMERTSIKPIFKKVQRHDPDSWRMTATVAAQGINSRDAVMYDNATAGEYAAIRELLSPMSLVFPNRIPRVAMAFSFAMKLVSNATVRRQSKPIHRPTGSRNPPICARKLWSRLAPGKKDKHQMTAENARMTVPAFFTNASRR